MSVSFFKRQDASGLAGLAVPLLCAVYPLGNVYRYLPFYALVLGSMLVAGVFLVRSLASADTGEAPPSISGGLPVYLFFGLMLLSTLWAFYPVRTLQTSVITLVFLWLFFLALLASKGDHRWIYRTATAVPLVCAAIFVLIFLRYGSIRVTSPEMKEAVGSVANVYPAMVILCLPFLVFLFLRAPDGRRSRIAAAGGYAAALFVISISGSRGALVLLATVVLLVSLVFGENVRSRLALFLKLATVTAATMAALTLSFGYAETLGGSLARFTDSRLFSITESATARTQEAVPGASDDPFSASPGGLQERSTLKAREAEATDKFQVPAGPDRRRTIMYLEGAFIISSYPVLGIGYNGLYSYIDGKYPFAIVSHNIIVTAWGELGLAGLVLAFWIFVSAAWWLLRARKGASREDYLLYSAALIALAVALVHAQLRPQLTNPMLYVLLGFALSKGSYRFLDRFVASSYARVSAVFTSGKPAGPRRA